MIKGRNRAWRRAYGVRDDAFSARLNTVMVGIVKSNDDPQHMGRLRVWIPEMGGEPDNEDNWFIVSYASPFAGATSINATRRDGTDMASASTSYGWWAVPPDLDNEVLVAFVNGDPGKGFWFACLYQQNMNHMVPGIPVGTPTSVPTASPPDPPIEGQPSNTPTEPTEATALPPVVEYNRWSNVNPETAARPVYTPLYNALMVQGLVNDPQRGFTSSGARREAPSKVFGFMTPGGSTIYADDLEQDPHIRLRTRNGTQVLINDADGYVYVNSGGGNSWLQVSDHSVDVYSLGTINVRSESSINFRADGSMNFEAVGNINMRSGSNINMMASGSIGAAANGDHIIEAGGTISEKAGAAILSETGGDIRMGAGGSISQGSAGDNIRSAGNIYDNAMAAPDAGALSAPKAEMIEGSITRRMPTHEPYSGHGDTGRPPAVIGAGENSGSVEGSVAGLPPGDPAADVSNLSATELDWLTCCVIDEAGNQGADGMAAVAQVIKNRMASRYQSDGTIKGTVLKKDQFSGFYHDTVNGRYRRVCSDLACAERRGLQKIARYKRSSSRWAQAQSISQQVMNGTYQGGNAFNMIRANRRCVMYLNYEVTARLNPNGSWRRWASPSKRVVKLGDHTFYVS